MTTARIKIKLDVTTPPIKDTYGKETTPAKYRTEKYELEADSVAAAVEKAQKLLDII